MLTSEFDKEAITAAGIIAYKVGKLSDERFARAGHFDADYVYEKMLLKNFSREVVGIAVQKCVKRGVFERVYVSECAHCHTVNLLVEEDERTRGSKRMLDEGCVGCEFCGNALHTSRTKTRYVIHHLLRPDDETYFSLDIQEEEFQSLRDELGFSAKLKRFFKSLFQGGRG